MEEKLNPCDTALYSACDEVLHYVWDPIGVSGIPETRDEYYGYVPTVFSMVRNNQNVTNIAAYLTEITTERMGLAKNEEHDIYVAGLLLKWKKIIDEKHTR
jgi:hypothetical protein